MEEKPFDEKAVYALALLFENFWILRSDDPAAYQTIREREHVVKRYVSDKFGYDLMVHQHFAKLEKMPVDPKPWMGIQAFQEPLDYAIFCCGLAFAEQKSADEQFLLSDLADDIATMYPGAMPLDWTLFQHRKSLVRALKMLSELRILQVVDGDLEGYVRSEDTDVLYEITVYARYFMRSYPENLFQFRSIQSLLEKGWERHRTDERRKRVYRQLMLSPAVHRSSGDDADFAYIRQFRNRLREDFEEHTPFTLETYKNTAMLVSHDRPQRYTLFPGNKGIMDVLLHFAAVVRSKVEENEDMINEFGDVRLPMAEATQWVIETKEVYGDGWSKAYREAGQASLMTDITNTLIDWEMAKVDEDYGMVVLHSAFGRMYGVYPKDFEEEHQ
ncbi:TIGR02678 family protein [Aureibacillus halotolerans]|uniref:Uncharacterized protein (TIGR02678 family) n=1 Tax=Aureibacillus halotolerans TaxID=1508390 RepID=A0A4R6TU78_9BACI|nr:TIGR02678 family protein [Aureibacillus halotolerans]TDQ34638.1 uncharacterized protein (TIGR02678 family) [Aureibacillus halotolerans]